MPKPLALINGQVVLGLAPVESLECSVGCNIRGKYVMFTKVTVIASVSLLVPQLLI